MSKKSKQTYFQDGWLSSEEFKAWLCKASTEGEARCPLCQINIALSNMGIRALSSRAGNKSHVKKVMERAVIKNFVAKRSDSRPANLSSEEKQLQSSLDRLQKIWLKFNHPAVQIVKARFHWSSKMEVN